MSRLLILIVVMWLAPSVAAAQDRQKAACAASNSDRIDIEGLWADERSLLERCVSVEGYRLGDAIFNDQRALYRHVSRRAKPATGIVGIPYPVTLESDSPGLMRGTYYGRVESCRQTQRNFARTLRNLNRSPPRDEIILVHLYGFCATSAGPAVRVEHADERPSSDLRRLTGDALRAHLGELVPIDARYRYRALVPWLTDVFTNGCTEEFNVQDPPSGGPPEGDGVPIFLLKLGLAQREQLARWCGSANRQRAMFTVNDTSPGAFERGTKLDVVLCLCVAANCTGRWPVALMDTRWGVARPYFCQRAKLRPRTSTYGEDGSPTEFGDYSYDFVDDAIAGGLWDEWGFPEP